MTQPKEPEPFGLPFWKEIEDRLCICHNTGWYFIDEWHECGVHFEGQLHPQSSALLLDDPSALQEAERVSVLNWKISKGRQEVAELTKQLRQAQATLTGLELELINKTPTIKFDVVKIPVKE